MSRKRPRLRPRARLNLMPGVLQADASEDACGTLEKSDNEIKSYH